MCLTHGTLSRGQGCQGLALHHGPSAAAPGAEKQQPLDPAAEQGLAGPPGHTDAEALSSASSKRLVAQAALSRGQARPPSGLPS